VGEKLNSQVETTCIFSLLANFMSMKEIGAQEGCEVTKGTIRYVLRNVQSILVSSLFREISLVSRSIFHSKLAIVCYCSHFRRWIHV